MTDAERSELEAARAVCVAAGDFVNARGKIQERTPLHDALARYYKTLREVAEKAEKTVEV